MMQEKYYGTMIHWFENMGRGSILPDNFDQRIFADGLSLAAHYTAPKSGDRVCFDIDRSRPQPSARNIEPASGNFQPAVKTTVILTEWDLMQNGGYGNIQGKAGQAVFILGQFLIDQSRVPETGDLLEGRLKKHPNGQWILVDAALVERETPQPADEVVKEPVTKYIAQTFYQAPEPESLVFLPADQVMSGQISHWNDEKGYGFIRLNKKSPKIFFHVSAFHYATRRPEVGRRVSFYCRAPIEGRQKAERIVFAGDEAFLFDALPPDYSRLNVNMATILPYSLTALAYLAAVALQSYKLAAAYLIACMVSFALYRNDKHTAVRNRNREGYRNRTPENTLHAADFLGGWPGGLVARAAFSHKTSKRPFIVKFWLTVAANLAITYALLIHYADNPLFSLLRN